MGNASGNDMMENDSGRDFKSAAPENTRTRLGLVHVLLCEGISGRAFKVAAPENTSRTVAPEPARSHA